MGSLQLPAAAERIAVAAVAVRQRWMDLETRKMDLDGGKVGLRACVSWGCVLGAGQRRRPYCSWTWTGARWGKVGRGGWGQVSLWGVDTGGAREAAMRDVYTGRDCTRSSRSWFWHLSGANGREVQSARALMGGGRHG